MRVLNRTAFPIFIIGLIMLVLGAIRTIYGFFGISTFVLIIGAVFIAISVIGGETLEEIKIKDKTDRILLYISAIIILSILVIAFLI